MAFDDPAPDLQKLITAWEQCETGEEAPGRVLANLKTAGLPEVLRQLADEGWTPAELMADAGATRPWRPGGAAGIPRPDAWSPGGRGRRPPPHPLHDHGRRHRGGPRPTRRPAQPIAPTFPDARPSAVLVALADGRARAAEVLLTRRSRLMRNHKGEISFPGGRIDPGETPVQAALREADEEVGLDPSRDVEVVGELDHLTTVVSRSYIVPIVGRLPRASSRCPGDRSRSSGCCGCRWPISCAPTRTAPSAGARTPTDRLLHFFELDDETVWGATAFVLVDLLTRL